MRAVNGAAERRNDRLDLERDGCRKETTALDGGCLLSGPDAHRTMPYTQTNSHAMDSINREQPEENREDLRGAAAIERIRDVGKANANCFFCTASPAGETGATAR